LRRLTGTISEVFIHPLKSARAVPVDAATVERAGFAGDRRWMLVDGRGHFVSQRVFPDLARIRAHTVTTRKGEALRLQCGGETAEFAVPAPSPGNSLRVEIWGETMLASLADGASPWLEQRLERNYRLVHLPDGARVRSLAGVEEPGPISAADGYPLLVVNRNSVDDLSARADTPIRTRQFRPNLVIDGPAAWSEDEWSVLRIAEARFVCSSPCERCVITTLDPDTGASRGPEPLRTLGTFRRRGGGVTLGINLTPVAGIGTSIRIGMDVEIT
jgi:uncharacterized protein YcbX